MKTQAVVIADDPVYLNWLQNAAPGAEFTLVRPIDAQDMIERIQIMGKVDMAFFQVDAASIAARALMIERLIDHLPDVPAAAVGADNNSEVVLAAMRAGARDFFVLRKDEANVAASLGRLMRRTAQAAQSARGTAKGKLFAVLSGHPHQGIAFLAEHLALASAQTLNAGNSKSERVLLLDVATPAGAAAIFLNIAQPYSVLDAINDVYRCDQTLVDTAFPKHGSGIYLLSLPEDFVGRPPLNHDEFLKLLAVLRGLFAVIVVTLDGHMPIAAIKGVVAQADRTMLMTDQSIIKSRHSKYLLRGLRLDDCPLDRTGLVVDNYRRRLGLEPQNLAELLDLPLLATLSTEGFARMQAMNSGEPLFTVAPKDPYCGDVRRLTSALMAGQSRVEEAPKSLLEKMFS